MSVPEALRRAVLTTLLPGFVGPTLPAWLDRRLREGLGGVCLFGSNIESPSQLRQLTAAIYAANPDAIVAIDEEGGDVTRLYYASGSPYPGNAILGRIDDLAFTEEVGRQVGWELRRAGCNVNFAPDIDINSNPDNPVIGVRSFGADAGDVARHGAAWTVGHQSAGVAVSAKHFPGHGDTAQDSHLALPVVDLSLDELRERELWPFAAVIAAGARTIMTSHILLPQIDPDNPATLSTIVLRGLLRDELGFEGVIVSDALDMTGASGVHGIPVAAARALAAGCNLLCLGTDNTDSQLGAIAGAIEASMESGELDASDVTASAAAVVALARGLAADRLGNPAPLDGEGSDPEFDLARIADSFDISTRAADTIRSAGGVFQLVRIETVANIAVGFSPWGLFAEFRENPDSPATVALTAHPAIVVSESVAPAFSLPASTPILVVGKDNHRHDFARDAIDRLRAQYDSVVVVDMGWPSDDREYADVATFGASRLAGRALAQLLTGARS